ncbi:hypothetical protein O9Z70_04690 [Devosia sp. YIM 151766]|uniref:hypothetical protein n=1 Tax=Devosia sp. YIM 151766 TaxID=3017325 RepID=UPI00255CD03B|nr:hypothetical protein [Devosia sp. YIM 151766]WIY53842.1 hypothetical protein O9Z70_04690 [Devosia sp. YIM 151766]
MTTPARLRLQTANLRGEVQATGAMLGPVEFHLDDRWVQPFAVAPWSDDPAERLADLPPLLRRLRGEWPCVPFGGAASPAGLPEDWSPGSQPDWHRHDHGYASNHDWSVEAMSDDAVTLAIRYPHDHPIERLERRIAFHPSELRIELTLTVLARQDVEMPIGLHPVFRLPAEAGAARLELGPGARLWSFPLDVEPGRSAAAPDQRDVAVEQLLGRDGAPLDIRALPLAGNSEDLLLATGTDGRVTLRNKEDRYAVTLSWMAADLPSCGLWLSNRGRAFYPWNGRFTAIGIEPVAAPFDLGPAFARDNPLSRAGHRTGIALVAGRPWSTSYAIAVTAC